jgi:hypothetical protein
MAVRKGLDGKTYLSSPGREDIGLDRDKLLQRLDQHAAARAYPEALPIHPRASPPGSA